MTNNLNGTITDVRANGVKLHTVSVFKYLDAIVRDEG